MRVRKTVWGGIFVATIVFTTALVLDILTNEAAIASAIYTETRMGAIFPAEVLALAVLSIPVVSAVSGIMFLIYFVKSRKQRKLVQMAPTS